MLIRKREFLSLSLGCIAFPARFSWVQSLGRAWSVNLYYLMVVKFHLIVVALALFPQFLRSFEFHLKTPSHMLGQNVFWKGSSTFFARLQRLSQSWGWLLLRLLGFARLSCALELLQMEGFELWWGLGKRMSTWWHIQILALSLILDGVHLVSKHLRCRYSGKLRFLMTPTLSRLSLWGVMG